MERLTVCFKIRPVYSIWFYTRDRDTYVGKNECSQFKLYNFLSCYPSYKVLLSSLPLCSACFQLELLGGRGNSCSPAIVQYSLGRRAGWAWGLEVRAHSNTPSLKIPKFPGFINKPWHFGDTWPPQQQWRGAGTGPLLTRPAARADEYVVVLSPRCDWKVVLHGETLLQICKYCHCRHESLELWWNGLPFIPGSNIVKHVLEASYWLSLQNS